MPERHSREIIRRKDRKKPDVQPFLQAPVILDRRERKETSSHDVESVNKEGKDTLHSVSSLPFLRRPGKFNGEAILKKLSDHPGHFIIGILGKQGVGKSTILSHFTQQPENAFSVQSSGSYLQDGHRTEGIDMYITPERAILLDTEPILCWTALDRVLRNGLLDGLSPDLWLEMDAIYLIIFLYSICNVVIVTTDGPEIDMNLLLLLQRAEMLKFNIPDFPLLTSQQDVNIYPEIVFVCNKCTKNEFTWREYDHMQTVIKSFFQESQLKTEGLISLGDVLPMFKKGKDSVNLFFLPNIQDDAVESFDVLIAALRDQVIATQRKGGRKGQVSEKDWFRNAVKTHELIRKSEYISEYLQMVKKLRDA